MPGHMGLSPQKSLDNIKNNNRDVKCISDYDKV